jgi:hypothetical protein
LQILTDDHVMIIDAVRTALGRIRDQDYAWNAPGDSAQLFAKVSGALDELGLLGPCERDSIAATSLTQALVAMEAGRAMIPFPVIEALMWTWLSARLESTPEAGMGAVVTLSGAMEASVAIADGRASGTLAQVPFADMAAALVAFPALSANADVDAVLVPLADATIRPMASVDSIYRLFEVDIDMAIDTGGLRLNDAKTRDRFALHRALLAAAELTGVGLKLISLTGDYLKVRVQFGKPLGANQALKHVLADDYVNMEALRSTIVYAAAALDADAPEAAELVWAAKHMAGLTGHELANHMLQAHGAIGYTTELELQRYMRRLFSLTAFHGSTYESGEALFRLFAKA